MAQEGLKETGLQFMSLGIVVEDKTHGSDIIKVIPIEKFSFERGDLTKIKRKAESKTPDSRGITKSIKVEGGVQLEAQWIPDGDNHLDNSPDVCMSETVKIYQYADTQEYYWTTIFREPVFRLNERRRISLSNKKDRTKAYDDNSSYWIEMDTINKHVWLHTSSNDGEPTAYDLCIDTKQGHITIVDEFMNKFFLNSVAKEFTADVGNSFTINTKRFILNASESIDLNTKAIKTKATTSLLTAVTHKEDAKAEVTKGLNVSGTGGAGLPAVKMVGNIEITGTVNSTGLIKSGSSITDGNNNSITGVKNSSNAALASTSLALTGQMQNLNGSLSGIYAVIEHNHDGRYVLVDTGGQ